MLVEARVVLQSMNPVDASVREEKEEGDTEEGIQYAIVGNIVV